MFKITLAALCLAILAGPVSAEGFTAKDRAGYMTDALKGIGKADGKGASAAKDFTNDDGSKGGWGNIGSASVNDVNGWPVAPKNPKGVDLKD